MVLGAIVAVFATPATPAAAGVSPGVTRLVSVRDDGTPGPDPNFGVDTVAVSGNGRYEAFDSGENLDPLTRSGEDNVYVRDLRDPGHTVLISRGAPPPILFGPGRSAKPIGSGDPHLAPATDTSTDTPPPTDPETPANGSSENPSISQTGRYVAFETTSTNILGASGSAESGESNIDDIIVCDRDPGGTGTFDRRNDDGSMDYNCFNVGRTDFTDSGNDSDSFLVREFSNTDPTISADGSVISWEQRSVAGSESETAEVVQIPKNPTTGDLSQPSESQYIDMHVNAPGNVEDGTNQPRLSADGRHVVYIGLCPDCPNLSGGGSEVLDINDLRNDPETGALESGTITRLDFDADNKPIDRIPGQPAVSGDGSVVVYSGEADGPSDVWAVTPGVVGSATMVSRTTSGDRGEGGNPAVSTDGRYVAFDTSGNNESNGLDITQPYSESTVEQVVVRDLTVDRAREKAELPRLPGELASPSINETCQESVPPDATCPGNAFSDSPSLDDNGSVVGFASEATDLVSGDRNDTIDAFARLFQPTVTASPLNFGGVPLGESFTQTMTVTQSGFGPVSVANVTITGTNSSDFTIFPQENCSGAVLHEADTCVVSVRFAPTETGPRTGNVTLNVGDDTPALGLTTPATSIAVSGNGDPAVISSSSPPPTTTTSPTPTPVGSFVATPNPLNFGGPRLALSTSATQVVTVRNNGTGPITIHNVTLLTGAKLFPGDYKIVSNTCGNQTLQPTNTCQVGVTNTPHGSGNRPGALEFNDDATGAPHLVGLNSTGTAPKVEVNPAVVVAGRVTTLTGTGWPANGQVILTIPQLPGSDTITANTKADGTFAVPLVVFDHAEVGTWAVNGTAKNTTLQASSTLLVVLGTYEPPGFTSREGD